MVRVFQVKLPLDHGPDAIPRAVARLLSIPLADVESCQVRRQAVDARKKTEIRLIYTVDVRVKNEDRVLKSHPAHRVTPAPDESYKPASPGSEPLPHRPVIVGSGPAGLFAGLILAQGGYRPIILERGQPVAQRCQDVARFWRDGTLDPESNAQFGEGGAGTFSDGKLTTLINDPRCRKVLEELAAAGAPSTILTSYKPHIGTDRLRQVVRTLRDTITSLGGEVRFQSRLTGIRTEAGRVSAIQVNNSDLIPCTALVLAIGHSARDTFAMLYQAGLAMTPKAFSIGARIEHPQQLIDQAQFGPAAGHPQLGAADYKLAFHAPGGRSAYTFCMCPGGQVIAAASAPGGVVTNGMSLHARAGANANSAFMVNVGPQDFGDAHPLAGFRFQERWENLAFHLAGGTYAAPVQTLGDFMAQRASAALGSVTPTYQPGIVPADLRQCLPAYVCDTIQLAAPAFGRQLRGFDSSDAVLTGVETRSSCPVRMPRGEDFQASIGGVYPAGEGAGYAGGIMSAAADGIRVGEAIIGRFRAG
ncbi:MAG: hypothetical protein IT443_05690 [Phycisphaeraceae bacterium]|nr:hypothetical protein [Phycisphaeraceae bacterium]